MFSNPCKKLFTALESLRSAFANVLAADIIAPNDNPPYFEALVLTAFHTVSFLILLSNSCPFQVNPLY